MLLGSADGCDDRCADGVLLGSADTDGCTEDGLLGPADG